MIAREWKTKFDISKKAALIKFAQEVSRPFLVSQAGNKGVFFFSEGDNWTTLTPWDNVASIKHMESNPDYTQLVKRITDLNALVGKSITSVYDCY